MKDKSPNSVKLRGWRAFLKFMSFKKRPADNPGAQFSDISGIADLKALEPSRREMIRGVINLSRRIVREIMIPRVDIVAVNVDIQLKELVKKVCDAGYSRVPVYKDSIDQIVGVLHAKDLLRFVMGKQGRFNVRRLMKKPFFVPETMPLDDLLREFKKRRLHMAIAVDEYGGFGGIVTLEDILEEIVGEIGDEFDEDEKPEFQKKGKDVYEVDPRMPLEDFCDELGVRLPTDEFDTLGGFVMDLFGGIPQKDQSVSFENLTFKIMEIEGTRINRISVVVSKKPAPSE